MNSVTLCRPIDLHPLRLDSGDLDTARALLAPDELARAARLRDALHRDRFIRGRAALRRVLAQRLACAPADVPLQVLAHGKPALRQDAAPAFNLAHCEHRGILAICDTGLLGVDIELLRPVAARDALAQRHFSAAEQAALASAPESGRDRIFLQVWTRKEAVLKMHGRGIAGTLAAIDVGAAGDAPAGCAASVTTFELEPGTIVSVATDCPRVELNLREQDASGESESRGDERQALHERATRSGDGGHQCGRDRGHSEFANATGQVRILAR